MFKLGLFSGIFWWSAKVGFRIAQLLGAAVIGLLYFAAIVLAAYLAGLW